MRLVAYNQKQLQTHLQRLHESTWKKGNKGKRPPLQCYFCYQSFAFEQSRETHMKLRIHQYSLTSGKFICNEETCSNLQLDSMVQLHQHFDNVHGEETIHRCSLCGWPFLNDSMRDLHELVHMRVLSADYEKNYTCPKCNDEWFVTYQKLRVHYVTKHTDLSGKLFKCVECGMDFKTNKIYLEHVQQHEMNRNLSSGVTTPNDYITCEECSKSFASRRHWSNHRRLVHDLAQCSKCGEAVPSAKLNGHMKERHKEGDPLPCPECGKVFYICFRLTSHIKHVHESKRIKSRRCHLCKY